MMCDADSHYMCNAIPYLGKGTVQLSKGQTLGEVFTVELTKGYGRRGRVVTTDNWFTSLPLALALRRNDLELVGTIKKKPYLPKEVQTFRMNNGESVAVFDYEDKVTLQCTKVTSTKRMQLLSTIHHRPKKIEKDKTDIQMFYNGTKGGVDTFDQMCAALTCSRKTRRWPLCFFYGIINLVMVNAYIISQGKEKKPMTRRNFHREVAEKLSYPWAISRLQGQVRLPRGLRTRIQSTFGVWLDPPTHPQDAGKTIKRQRCYICPRVSNVKTRLVCGTCKRNVCPQHLHYTCMECTD